MERRRRTQAGGAVLRGLGADRRGDGGGAQAVVVDPVLVTLRWYPIWLKGDSHFVGADNLPANSVGSLSHRERGGVRGFWTLDRLRTPSAQPSPQGGEGAHRDRCAVVESHKQTPFPCQ